jgi:hypothetical protein
MPASPLFRTSRLASRRSVGALGLAALTLAATPAVADVRLDVGAGPIAATEDHLDVTVEMRNEGATATGPLDVDGEIFEHHSLASVTEGIPAGEARSVTLRFPPDVPRAGVHPVSLLLDYAAAGTPGTRLSQRAYLLVALGEAPPPAVRVVLGETRLDWAGEAILGVESVDGLPHAVRLRLEGPRGLRVVDPDGEIAVPPRGIVRVPVRIFRGTLPWDTVQGVLAVATTTDGPAARTTVTAGSVRVLPDPAWLPRFRKPLLLVTLLLLGAAAFAEAWKRLA